MVGKLQDSKKENKKEQNIKENLKKKNESLSMTICIYISISFLRIFDET